MTIPSTTDDLIAEIEAEAKALEWTGKWYYAGCGTVHCDYKGQDPDDHHGEVAHPEPIGAASYIASASPANVLTLIARIRELDQYKSEAIEVMGPVLDYARPLNLAKLGESITQALISDHQRLVELEQAQRWIPCSERLPEVRERLDSPLKTPCGHEVLPLNISVPVIYYDGNSAKSGPLNWFDGGAPINGVTHWMPLPGRPT